MPPPRGGVRVAGSPARRKRQLAKDDFGPEEICGRSGPILPGLRSGLLSEPRSCTTAFGHLSAIASGRMPGSSLERR